jgi:glycyl-tRNA synthetase beta chain
MTVSDFLVELGTEELPSASVWPLADALGQGLRTALAEAGIAHGELRCFASPRRLAVLIRGVEAKQANQSIARRGPACAVAAADSPAVLGFAKSCGVGVDELSRIKTDKGEWWNYESEKPGALSKVLLPAMVNTVVSSLPVAKPMRWGGGELQFARPLHWLVLLWGSEVLEAEILGIASGRETYGHRFHHPAAVSLPEAKAYEDLLQQAKVMADFAQRQQYIAKAIDVLATQQGYHALIPPELLLEVTSIVEWPQVLMASFDPAFLKVPAEALIAAMQSHQKCFALQDKHGKLVPFFILVANIVSTSSEAVIRGNESVMRARLSDAAFFYQQDRRQKLADYYPATAQVVFQARLGSLQAKTQRMQVLMQALLEPLALNAVEAQRAVHLSKCDLMTGMVGEFPELQGLMGCDYARHDGEALAVAQALQEHYRPRFSADELPQGPLGLALSLLDRLDTLVGCFAAGLRPSSVKDPFKLRRHALALARLLMAIPSALSLSDLIRNARAAYADILPLKEGENLETDLQAFIQERLQAYYEGQGIAKNFVDAALACQADCFFDLDQRVRALVVFVQLPEAQHLAMVSKRVNHLLQQAKVPQALVIQPSAFKEAAEHALFVHLEAMMQRLAPLYQRVDYVAILNELAGLYQPLGDFFETVMVMVDEPVLKANRLALLQQVQQVLRGVADISLL